MMRLLSIEFFKLKNTKFFWVLTALFALMLLSIPFAASKVVGLINEGKEVIDQFSGVDLPFFDFVDIWQNLYFLMKWFSVYLGFIIVISVTNDQAYGIQKQNIIDGLSRREYMFSKLSIIIALALLFTMISALIILVMGYLYSPVTEWVFITEHIEFVPAYFLHLVAMQLFCMAVALVIKRSGITIAFLLFYVYMIEPIIQAILMNYGMRQIGEFLPVNAISNIIRFPYGKYALQYTQTSVSMIDLSILVLVILGSIWGIQRLLTKRDLT